MEKNLIQIIEEAVKNDTISVANTILAYFKSQSDQPTKFTKAQEINLFFGKRESKTFRIKINSQEIFTREWNERYARKIVAGAIPYINKGIGTDVVYYSKSATVYADYEEVRISVPPLVNLEEE